MLRIDADTDLLSQLMPKYREIGFYRQLCNTEGIQLDALLDSLEQVDNNFFVQTMDESTVSQWEQIFSISPNPETESLDFRRARILNRISTKPPFTLGFLYQKLDEFFGPGNYTVEVDYPNYTLYIESSAENQAWAGEIAVTIGTIKPCHIVYINRPYLSDTILISEQIDLSKFEFNYLLGGWGLGLEPFADVIDLGVIKTPEQKSIQEALLAETAASIVAAAVSARINGQTVITNLTKTTDGATASISYTVTQEQAPTVTLVELLDEDGVVLTSSGVYVPITEQAVFKNNFQIKEGT